MSDFKTPLALTPEVVRAAYLFMLRRNPDSAEAVDKAVDYFEDAEALASSIRTSEEWRARQLHDTLAASAQKMTRFQSRRGFNIFLDLTDVAVSGAIWFADNFEPHVEKMVMDHCNWGEIFVDAGANVGWFSMIAGNRIRWSGGRGQVIGIEANPRLAMLASASVVDNNLLHIVQIRNMAASDTAGVVQMYNPGGHAAGGKLLDPHWAARVGGAADTAQESWRLDDHVRIHKPADRVPAMPLDDILGKVRQRVGLIKLDVEGHEPMVLKGAARTLATHRPRLIIEVNPDAMELSCRVSPEALVKQLDEFGYDLFNPEEPTEPLSPAAISEKLAVSGYADFLGQPRP